MGFSSKKHLQDEADAQGPVTMLFDSRERKKGASSTPASGASTPTPKKEVSKEEAAAIAKAKNDARKAKKEAWEKRKAEQAAAEATGAAGAESK